MVLKMIKIKLSKEIMDRHLQYFEEKVLPNFDQKIKFSNISDNNAHIEFMKYCKEKHKILAIGKPLALRIFGKKFSKNINSLLYKNPKLSYEGKKIKYKEFLLKVFGYENFCNLDSYVSNETLTQYNYMEIESKLKNYWTPYNIVLLSNIRVCPYCNRQYITPIYIHSNKKNEKHKLRADLDHFFPKNEYPYFSMSLYNLVPCCKFCNSSLKNIKEFNIKDVNPYEENFDDYFKFKTDILNDDKIFIEKTNDYGRIDNYLNYFQIEALYNYNKNQAEELVKKRLIYPDSYIEELYESNKSNFSSKSEIKQLIIGYIQDKTHLNDEAFAKFRRDIAEQLHFIDCKSSVDRKLLEELKQINWK